MKKASSKAVAHTPERLVFEFDDPATDFYRESSFVVTWGKPINSTEIAGWKAKQYGRVGGDSVFEASFGSESSCCGFPVMMDFVETERAEQYYKEIGDALKEGLQKKMAYVAAYVPNKPDYTATRKILERAGFVAGLTLNSSHNNDLYDDEKPYTNTRWEWFTEENNLLKGMLRKVKDAKTVPPLAV